MYPVTMSALFELLAVAMIALTVGAWTQTGLGSGPGGVRDTAARGGRRRRDLLPHARAMGIAVAVVCAFTFWTNVWPFWTARGTERQKDAALTADLARFNDAAQLKVNHAFFEFAGRRIGPDGTFAVVPSSALQNADVLQWGTYVLAPALLTSPDRADWLIVYDSDPGVADYDRRSFPELEHFAPKFAIGRRRDAE
jgi:hypothetical protein